MEIKCTLTNEKKKKDGVVKAYLKKWHVLKPDMT